MSDPTTSSPQAADAGLLLGYGSVGRFHAGVLARRYGKLAIVEVAPDARARAASDHPDCRVAASLGELADWPWASTLATVATWGPTHEALVLELADRGVPRILCEKPLASSVAAAHKLADLVDGGLRLGVHLQRRYNGVIPGLHQLTRELGIGAIDSVVIHGGARCLVTTGVHYLDLVCGLFDGLPGRVIADSDAERINPRSPDLGFYGGTAVWTFGGGRRLTMSFTNRSSVLESLHLYCRDAVIDMSFSGQVSVRARKADEVEALPAVTRAGAASEVVFAGDVPGVEPPPVPTERILDELERGGAQQLTARTAADIIGATIGALTSAASGRAVTLPIDRSSDDGRLEWRMS